MGSTEFTERDSLEGSDDIPMYNPHLLPLKRNNKNINKGGIIRLKGKDNNYKGLIKRLLGEDEKITRHVYKDYKGRIKFTRYSKHKTSD